MDADFASAKVAVMFVSWSHSAAHACCALPSPLSGWISFTFFFFLSSPLLLFVTHTCRLFVSPLTSLLNRAYMAVSCYHKVHLVLWVCFKFSTPTPMDLFEENERCLQNVWSKPGLVAQGLQLMLIRCPSASHGAYDCLVSKQIVYF